MASKKKQDLTLSGLTSDSIREENTTAPKMAWENVYRIKP
ncbi:hypothetical protein CWATWH8502_2203 [Crocosphaera watsonii WH 8502]|uniref:Uncharacterized protein n=1 Tax=Crocosphaera watsonii WH 8502 TaxID=423474 RepID=T2IIR6_CROWT|nr:hypothetical protein CWATWH8502_2203 [Crocosphaera watsonii WH 8502]